MNLRMFEPVLLKGSYNLALLLPNNQKKRPKKWNILLTPPAGLPKVALWGRSFSRFSSAEVFPVQMDLEMTALYSKPSGLTNPKPT